MITYLRLSALRSARAWSACSPAAILEFLYFCTILLYYYSSKLRVVYLSMGQILTFVCDLAHVEGARFRIRQKGDECRRKN